MKKKTVNQLSVEDIKEIIKTADGLIDPDTDIMHDFPTEESYFKAVIEELRKNAE